MADNKDKKATVEDMLASINQLLISHVDLQSKIVATDDKLSILSIEVSSLKID
jgi:hypothetical protein